MPITNEFMDDDDAKLPTDDTKLPTDKEEYKMPEEFAADTTESEVTTPSNGMPDFTTIGFDDDRDEAERAKLNPPTGDWEKEDRWKFEHQVYNQDSMTGDIDVTGRTFLKFIGKPKSRELNGNDFEPMLFLRISPDRRYKQDKPTEIDTAYKLFLKAKDMYVDKYSEKPRNIMQLVNMLTEDEYLVRTMNGDNGPIIVDVKLKRVRK